MHIDVNNIPYLHKTLIHFFIRKVWVDACAQRRVRNAQRRARGGGAAAAPHGARARGSPGRAARVGVGGSGGREILRSDPSPFPGWGAAAAATTAARGGRSARGPQQIELSPRARTHERRAARGRAGRAALKSPPTSDLPNHHRHHTHTHTHTHASRHFRRRRDEAAGARCSGRPAQAVLPAATCWRGQRCGHRRRRSTGWRTAAATSAFRSQALGIEATRRTRHASRRWRRGSFPRRGTERSWGARGGAGRVGSAGHLQRPALVRIARSGGTCETVHPTATSVRHGQHAQAEA